MRKARIHAGIGSAQIGEAIGCARNTISNYENGRTDPPKSVVLAWSMVTGVDREWLLGEEMGPAVSLPTGR